MMKRILLAVFITLMMVSFVSAWDITANNGKDYNATTQTVKIYDDYLVTKVPIADIKLDTPIHNYAVHGADSLIAEVTFDAKTDYTDAFKKIRFYDQEGNEIQREIRYKVKVDTGRTYEHTELDKGNCTTRYDTTNKTNYESCENKRIKTQVPIYEWKEIDLSSLKNGEFKTLGLFTEVKAGDYVEWIPEWFGVTINEWATWQSTYNVGMVVAYKLNETSGTNGEDFWHLNNLTHTNTVPETSGKIGYGINLSNGQTGSISQANTGFSGDVDKSYCFWLKPKYYAKYVFSASTEATNMEAVYIGGDTIVYLGGGEISTGLTTTVGTWYFICFTSSAATNAVNFYNNGINYFNVTQAFGGSATKLRIGNSKDGATASSGNWTLDEFIFWNRTLTPAEVNAMYNGGSGMTPEVALPDTKPIVNLNATPVNYYNSTTKAITLNCSATDDIGLTNLRLILDGVVNTSITNTSSGTTSMYLQSALYLTEGTHTWNCNASDGVNVDGINVTRTLTVDTINPQVNITRPVSNTNYSNGLNVINFSIYDANPSICVVGNETTNFTISCSSANYALTPHQGSNTWMVFANDTVGNWNRTTVTFFYDNVYPQIEFDAGTLPNGTKRTVDNFPVYVVPAESNFKNMTYFYMTGAITNFIEYDTVVLFQNYTSMADGNYLYNVSVCDTSGNCNSTKTRSINIDTKIPQVNITYPINGSNYGTWLNVMNFSIVDGNAETCFAGNETTNFSIGCGSNNYSMTPHQGWNTWNVFANDTYGNWNLTSVTFNYDGVTPIISFANKTDGLKMINQTVNWSYTNWEGYEPSGAQLCVKKEIDDLWYSSACASTWKAVCQYLLDASCSASVGTYSWDNARSYCEGLGNGWHLAILNSSTLQTGCTESGWIGARNQTVGGYAWIDLVYNSSSELINKNSISANVTASDSNLANITTFLYSSSGLVSKYKSLTSPSYYTFPGLSDGIYYMNATAYDSFGNYNHTQTLNITVDTVYPIVSVDSPKGNYSYFKLGSKLDLNYSVSDVALSSCWYEYNGANTSLPSCANTTITPVTPPTGKSLKVFAEDTSGNINYTSTNWDYNIFETGETHDYNVVGGSYHDFKFYTTIRPGTSIASASVVLDGTSYPATTTNLGGDTYSSVSNLLIPFTLSGNKSFYWHVILLSGETGNSQLYYTNVTTIEVGTTCGAGTIEILNFTTYDESTRTFMPKGNIEAIVSIYPSSAKVVLLANSSANATDGNLAFCVPTSIISGSQFSVYYETKYYNGFENNTYWTEYKYDQNILINSTSSVQNIGLYILNATYDTKVFKVVYKNNVLAPVSEALIDVLREYPATNEYISVETAQTNYDGITFIHLVETSVNYRIVISKNGKILSTFATPFQVKCSYNGDCTVYLNAQLENIPSNDWVNYKNLRIVSTLDESTRTLTAIYNTIDGTVQNVSIKVTAVDEYNNRTIYSSSQVASSGGFVVPIPNSYGNISLIVDYRINNQRAGAPAYFSIGSDPSEIFGGSRVLFGMIMYSTLVLMFIPNPITIVVGAILGFAFAGLFMIIDTGASFIGTGSVILWFVLACAILFWQINRRLNS